MVENHIHHHLQTTAVGFVAQAAILLVGAKTWIYLVVVGRGIAMVGADVMVVAIGRVVLEHGSEPQCGHTQLGEVIQVLADALDIAAVA